KGVIAFIIMQLLALVIVAYSPRLVNYLPLRVSLTGETAPPPINPKLQLCVEEHIYDQFQTRGNIILTAIGEARKLDLSSLPKKMQKAISGSFDKAEKTADLIKDVQTAATAVAAAKESYRPLHRQVREIEAVIRRIDARIKDVRADITRASGASTAGLRKELEGELARLEAEKKEREATIPDQWDEQHKKFAGLLKAETKARNVYRRNVDSAYSPVGEAVTIVGAADALAAARPGIEALRESVATLGFEEGAEKVKEAASKVGAVAGARKVRSAVNKVRRALRGRSPDKERALKALDKALEVHADEVQWRQSAAKTALPGLVAYEATIRDTIGLRQQSKLPEDKAPEIAGCMAHHRDISLSF
ncbi:MAG: C4-dicarboxylate ABC transporter permease, partial [Methyloligellaceae bacterium]